MSDFEKNKLNESYAITLKSGDFVLTTKNKEKEIVEFVGDGSKPELEIPNGVVNVTDKLRRSTTTGSFDAINHIKMPDSVKNIEKRAFTFCNNLETVEFGNNVRHVYSHAFAFCSNLSSLTLNDSLMYIDKRAFNNCNSLTEITIPKNIKSLGEGAFSDCTRLKTVYWNAKNCENAGKTSMTLRNTSFGTVFSGSYNMETVHFGPEVEVIPTKAFLSKGCVQKFDFDNANSLKIIQPEAFSYCSGISEIKLPNSVEHIGNYAFYYCKNVGSLSLNDGLKYIGMHAFTNTSIIGDVIIPSSVEVIEARAFYNCTNITSVKLSKNIKKISNSAFSLCTSLKDIYFDGTKSEFISCFNDPNIFSLVGYSSPLVTVHCSDTSFDIA